MPCRVAHSEIFLYHLPLPFAQEICPDLIVIGKVAEQHVSIHIIHVHVIEVRKGGLSPASELLETLGRRLSAWGEQGAVRVI